MPSFDIFFVVGSNNLLRETVELSVIWAAMLLMWRQYKGNGTGVNDTATASGDLG